MIYRKHSLEGINYYHEIGVDITTIAHDEELDEYSISKNRTATSKLISHMSALDMSSSVEFEYIKSKLRDLL